MINLLSIPWKQIWGIIVVLAIILVPTMASAQSLRELQDQLRRAEADAQKYRELEAKEHANAQLYTTQIKATEDQIRSVQSAIQTTLGKISTKEQDINQTTQDISGKNKELEELRHDLDQALITLYESDQSLIYSLASANTLSEYADLTANIESIESYLTDVMNQVNGVKKELEDKKGALEQQRSELAALKEGQQAQKVGLEQQKKKKDSLLVQAKQQEEKYEDLAEQAELKKQEFNRKLADLLRSGGPVIRKGPVNQGDVIGYMGNSGFSTGAHLHWETIKNGGYINPRNNTPGLFIWPFRGAFRVTQEFGQNWKLASGRWAYRNGGHTGIDIVGDGGEGTPVIAACSGTIIEPFAQYNGYMPGGYGYYRAIECKQEGWVHLYAHLRN